MQASFDGSKILLLGGNGEAYAYDGLTDVYTSSSLLFSPPITGYYGPMAIGPFNDFLLANGLVLSPSLSVIGGATAPGLVPVNPPTATGSAAQNPLRNVAAVAALDSNDFVRMTTPVRASVTATTTDDVHTTLQQVNILTGATQTVARMPENPVFSLFGATRTAVPSRQMAVDPAGTVYALTLSGLSVVPITPVSSATQPALAPTTPVVNATDGSTSFSRGSFIMINGSNLASSGTASALPAPTVLGGSCALLDGVPLPLLSTSPNQMVAQIPATIRSGENVLQVRSLNNAQQSSPIVVTLK